MENIYQSISKNDNGEIIFIDLIEQLPKILSSEKQYDNYIIINYNKIFNSMINNIKNIKQEKFLMRIDILSFFIPKIFQIIELDDNIFDLIEKYLFKKCCFCSNTSKNFYICLICGDKFCNSEKCNLYSKHKGKCTGGIAILINMFNMKLVFLDLYEEKKELFALYVDKSGVGPNAYIIGEEYNLSKEKIKIAVRGFISNDLH